MAKNKETTQAPGPMYVRIENTRPASIGLPECEGFDSVNLIPGGNNVRLEYLKAIKSHHQVSWYFRKGWLVLKPTGEGEPEGPPPPPDLSGYKEAGALLLVQAESDLATLHKWQRADTRPAVVDAIQARRSALGG